MGWLQHCKEEQKDNIDKHKERVAKIQEYIELKITVKDLEEKVKKLTQQIEYINKCLDYRH